MEEQKMDKPKRKISTTLELLAATELKMKKLKEKYQREQKKKILSAFSFLLEDDIYPIFEKIEDGSLEKIAEFIKKELGVKK